MTAVIAITEPFCKCQISFVLGSNKAIGLVVRQDRLGDMRAYRSDWGYFQSGSLPNRTVSLLLIYRF
jgi:hypothetical protein